MFLLIYTLLSITPHKRCHAFSNNLPMPYQHLTSKRSASVKLDKRQCRPQSPCRIVLYVKDNSDDNETEDVEEDDLDSKDQSKSSNQTEDLRSSPPDKKPPQNAGKILSLLSNPFEAGKSLRQSLDSAFGTVLSPQQRSIYYLDDRFRESSTPSENALAFAERSPLFDQFSYDEDYIPEVLVIGATGEIGRLVVRRLVLSGKFRVRVLVRDLYSRTLNLLGTGVTYCQGDLSNVESLEYALTDVDKIVFCAGPPRQDEEDFKSKFNEFVKENLDSEEKGTNSDEVTEISPDEEEFQRMASLIELRSKLAEQVDGIGMDNVVKAYQNVRHADYGTSQAAKRSLFKFQDREEDFNLFYIDTGDDEASRMDLFEDEYKMEGEDLYDEWEENTKGIQSDIYEEDQYANPYANSNMLDGYSSSTKASSEDRLLSPRSQTQAQVSWIRNKFRHGVFVGKLPTSTENSIGESQAAIISSRLSSREDPERGIDLSNAFAGLICRICADGKNYEAFIRTSEYEREGIEYVCKFSTKSKPTKPGSKSANKFVTVRLPFSNFVPKRRRGGQLTSSFPKFSGKDVKHLGFRVNSKDMIGPVAFQRRRRENKEWNNFYLAFCYIKAYRSQPEPEFVYLSDGLIPPVVLNGMVCHDSKQIMSSDVSGEVGESATIFDEIEAKKVMANPKDRSAQETYYKYCGEDILSNSGLSYTVIRVAALNELKSATFSSIRLTHSNEDLIPVSRAEVADVCVSALLDPNARNLCFYVTKAKPGGTVASEFRKLNSDSI